MGKVEISLVICTYNRDKYLPEALNSIRNQTMPSDKFQLIIVDNNSTDNTAAISRNFIETNPQLNIKYAFEPNKGLSFARNRGIQEANSNIISYVDDDAILTPDFLVKMVGFFDAHPGAVGAGGKVTPKYESGKEPVWMNKYLAGFVGLVDFGPAPLKFEKAMKYPAGCNMTYRKDVLLKVGGFNNSLTFRSDDKYIFFKVKEYADEVYYVPDASVLHYIDSHRLEFSNFRKLFLKTGNEEKIRIRTEHGSIALLKKGTEYILKAVAAILVYFLFILKGQEIKGRYVFFSQWFTLRGFFMNKVHVR